MADVELAVQMIGFMQKGAGQQFLARFSRRTCRSASWARTVTCWARHVLAEIRDAEAAFALRVLAFGVNDFRIDQHELGVRDLL